MSILRTARPFGALLLIGTLAATLAPTGALAQMRATDKGWTSGISIGGTQIGMSDNVAPVTGATASSFSKDESSTGFKIFFDYRFNQNFALEGGYVDFGKFDARRDVTAPVTGTLTRNLKSSGFDLTAMGILPMDNGFSLFAKAGGIYTMTRGSISTSGGLIPVATLTDLSPKRSELNPKFGVGLGYQFSNGLGLRLEYERVMNVGDGSTMEGHIGMWSLGLTKRY